MAYYNIWLKNRQKAIWRDKQEIAQTVNATVESTVTTASQESIAALEAKIAKAMELSKKGLV